MVREDSFMDNKVVKSLEDILAAINEIESYFDAFPRRFDVFSAERVLNRAIQMNIAIIGEATNRILKTFPDIEISHARKIVNTRNYVIHGYDSLSYEMLWSIVINDLPRLKAEVGRLLNAL